MGTTAHNLTGLQFELINLWSSQVVLIDLWSSQVTGTVGMTIGSIVFTIFIQSILYFVGIEYIER